MSPRLKNLFYWLSATVITVFAVAWIFKNAEQWEQLKTAFGKFQVTTILLALGVVIIQVFFQSLRLWMLVPGRTTRDIRHVTLVQVYGQFLNSFLPARAGDALKAVKLTGPTLPFSGAVGVLLADKVIDTLSFIMLCLCALPFWMKRLPVDSLLPAFRGGYLVLGAIALGACLGLVPSIRVRIRSVWHGFVSGLVEASRPKVFVLSIAFSIGSWLGEMTCLGLLAQNQGFPLGPTELIWVLTVLNIGIAIPISVANVGAFEGSVIVALRMFDVEPTAAMTIAICHHILQIGAVCLWAFCFWFSRQFIFKVRGPVAPEKA